MGTSLGGLAAAASAQSLPEAAGAEGTGAEAAGAEVVLPEAALRLGASSVIAAAGGGLRDMEPVTVKPSVASKLMLVS
ncbi:MAG: hypothetical protein ABW220_16800 [Burkholderiaceae bacterium]